MANFPADMDATEKRICARIITNILNAGHHVRVSDESGEPACSWTRDRAVIEAATCNTDMTIYYIGKPSEVQTGKFSRLGWIQLVHGNGEDVVCDCGAKDDALLKHINGLTY